MEDSGIVVNGLNVKLLVMNGFTGSSEVALEVGGKIVSTVRIAKKRNGNISVVPSLAGGFVVKSVEEPPKLSLHGAVKQEHENLLDGVAPTTAKH